VSVVVPLTVADACLQELEGVHALVINVELALVILIFCKKKGKVFRFFYEFNLKIGYYTANFRSSTC
jgi:hypothetical protein